MAEKEKQEPPRSRVSADKRMKYIGFEVYPGKPRDLFKSDAEKQEYVDSVIAKRERVHLLALDPSDQPGPPALARDLVWIWPLGIAILALAVLLYTVL